MSGLRFTKVPTDTFEKLQLNAGILVDAFNPATAVIGNILGATSGGINFASNPSFSDFGENIDNIPNNMKELKHLDGYDPSMSGTFLTVSPAVAKMLVGAADIDGSDSTHVVPRQKLLAGDFTELWWIGDYSDKNTGDNAGFLAIRLINALNTSGFQIQSGKNAKGTMSFDFHGHYSIDDQDTVPFEIYVKAGTSGSDIPSVRLNNNYVTVVDEQTVTLMAVTVPAGQTVTWSSSATGKATVADGVVTGKDPGNCIITAAITVDGVTYNDTCTVVVTAS